MSNIDRCAGSVRRKLIINNEEIIELANKYILERLGSFASQAILHRIHPGLAPVGPIKLRRPSNTPFLSIFETIILNSAIIMIMYHGKGMPMVYELSMKGLKVYRIYQVRGDGSQII